MTIRFGPEMRLMIPIIPWIDRRIAPSTFGRVSTREKRFHAIKILHSSYDEFEYLHVFDQ